MIVYVISYYKNTVENVNGAKLVTRACCASITLTGTVIKRKPEPTAALVCFQLSFVCLNYHGPKIINCFVLIVI